MGHPARRLWTRVRRRPAAVRTMALLCGVSGLSALLSALFPMTPATPVGLDLVLAAVAAGLAGLVWAVPSRLVLHLGELAHVAGLSLVVASAATVVGTASGSVGFVWVGLYAAFFLGRRAARVYTVLLAAGLAAGLLLNPFTGAVHLWLLMTCTTAVATDAVAALVARLERAAATDPLTGALNRNGLALAAPRALAGADRGGRPLTLAVLDLDGFKQVNDRHGHAAGDRVLVGLVDACRAGLRAGDVLARLGGDEFVLLLPRTDVDEARSLLARLRDASPLGWSAGLAAQQPGDDLDALLLRADRDLYRAKQRRTAVPGR